MRTPLIHPDWCGQNHVCTAEMPTGEHRSYPLTVDTPTGRIVATRIRTVGGRDRLEVRTVVDLPTDAHQSRRAAGRVLVRLRQALTLQTPGRGPA